MLFQFTPYPEKALRNSTITKPLGVLPLLFYVQ